MNMMMMMKEQSLLILFKNYSFVHPVTVGQIYLLVRSIRTYVRTSGAHDKLYACSENCCKTEVPRTNVILIYVS